MTIIHPQGFRDVVEWADRMAPLLETKTANYPRLDDPADWQRWASALFLEENPRVLNLGQDTPDPREFDDWREWAMRLFATTDFTR